jgi:signal transduction histidine kinase
MWSGVGFSLLFTILALFALVAYVLWSVISTFSGSAATDLLFVFSSTGLVTMALIRLLAIMIGAAIAFAGLAVSFFAHEQAITISMEGKVNEAASAKMALATHSPGIVALLVGAMVIIVAVYSKTKHEYKPQPDRTTVSVQGTNEETALSSDELDERERQRAQRQNPPPD